MRWGHLGTHPGSLLGLCPRRPWPAASSLVTVWGAQPGPGLPVHQLRTQVQRRETGPRPHTKAAWNPGLLGRRHGAAVTKGTGSPHPWPRKSQPSGALCPSAPEAASFGAAGAGLSQSCLELVFYLRESTRSGLYGPALWVWRRQPEAKPLCLPTKCSQRDTFGSEHSSCISLEAAARKGPSGGAGLTLPSDNGNREVTCPHGLTAHQQQSRELTLLSWVVVLGQFLTSSSILKDSSRYQNSLH